MTASHWTKKIYWKNLEKIQENSWKFEKIQHFFGFLEVVFHNNLGEIMISKRRKNFKNPRNSAYACKISWDLRLKQIDRIFISSNNRFSTSSNFCLIRYQCHLEFDLSFGFLMNSTLNWFHTVYYLYMSVYFDVYVKTRRSQSTLETSSELMSLKILLEYIRKTFLRWESASWREKF